MYLSFSLFFALALHIWLYHRVWDEGEYCRVCPRHQWGNLIAFLEYLICGCRIWLLWSDSFESFNLYNNNNLYLFITQQHPFYFLCNHSFTSTLTTNKKIALIKNNQSLDRIQWWNTRINMLNFTRNCHFFNILQQFFSILCKNLIELVLEVLN